MSPLDRLLLEAIPTPCPAPDPRPTVGGPGWWTRDEQDAHWQALCDEVGAPDYTRPTHKPTVLEEAA